RNVDLRVTIKGRGFVHRPASSEEDKHAEEALMIKDSRMELLGVGILNMGELSRLLYTCSRSIDVE
ncbi:hypothetical protein M8C21_024752, partial [Ambrosia artemisiifolia]